MTFFYNFSDHTIYDKEKSKTPKQLFVFFLSPNVAGTHQLAGMGMISSIRVGYKVTLLEHLLSIFILKKET